MTGPVDLELLSRRLQKNHRHLARWLRNQAIECYRLYDRELDEFPLTIDVYGEHAYVQTWEGKETEALLPLRASIAEVVAALTGVDAGRCRFQDRRRQREFSQYEKMSTTGQRFVVQEAGLQFWVNLRDYVDSGLFLDHRATRARVRSLAAGRTFLNLFCYTGSVTVHAAAGGAASTTSVDLSRTYLRWARDNLKLNGLLDPRHEFVQADCLTWLRGQDRRFDLIFLDPPTFSKSKRMATTFDVQRDHIPLLQDALHLLAPGGQLLFSSNRRNFRLDSEALFGFQVRDITRATLDKDFERKRPPAHQCFRIQHQLSAPVPPEGGASPESRVPDQR